MAKVSFVNIALDSTEVEIHRKGRGANLVGEITLWHILLKPVELDFIAFFDWSRAGVGVRDYITVFFNLLS